MLARAKTVEKRVAHVVAAFSAREQSGCLMKAEEEARAEPTRAAMVGECGGGRVRVRRGGGEAD